MVETIIGLVSALAQLGLKLYQGRNDQHEALVKAFQDLQSQAAVLEAALHDGRIARDAATMAKLDELEHKGLAAALSQKVP